MDPTKSGKTKACEECGMFATSHALMRLSARMDRFSKTLFGPLDEIVERITPFSDKLINSVAHPLASLLFSTGLAQKITAPDRHSWETAQALWEEAEKRGIEMYEVRIFGLPRRHFIARYENEVFAFEGIPRPTRRQKSIGWLDDKAEMSRRLQEAGFPVPKNGSARNEKEALEVFEKLPKPVIVKPLEGSGGRHTTVGITNKRDLLAAFRNAKVIAPVIVIQEELKGPVYRITLVERKLTAVLRRDPPQVTGDGRSTIRELVEEENKNPLRRGPVFAEINLDSKTAKNELARKGLAPESVPGKGQVVYFHFKVNWGVGGTSRDATPEIHPENRKLFEDLGNFIGDDIIGIDFMTEDISKSWRKTERCGIIECNSLPTIGNHHFPYTGPVRNVAGEIWSMVFPKTKRRSN